MARIIHIGACAMALAFAPAVMQGLSAQDKAYGQELGTPLNPISPELRRTFEEVVRDYLLKNPAIIREAMRVLQTQEDAAKQARAALALKQYRSELVLDVHSPVGGNPKGDITVVSFFDYNCGYCKRVALTVSAVLKSDPKVRVVYKELAILGPQSILAARAALAAKRQGKYHEFHGALMSAERANADSVAAIASDLALDYAKLVKDMEDPAIDEQLERTYRLATAIGINGTPAFVIGDRLVAGAINARAMNEIIVAERAKMEAVSVGN